jgi:hypothetical protein
MKDVDFTYAAYEELLATAQRKGFVFLPVREYIERAEDGNGSLPERFLILRHDVDRKPRNALAMARIESDYGIAATYYVRTIEKTLQPDIVERIAGLGHEVGYHYEDMDRADGDPDLAVDSFADNLAALRAHVPVDTVCMHGNPLTPHDNRDLWEHTDFERFDLRGEGYLSMDFTDVTYFSDTGRTWLDGDLKIKDHTVGADDKSVQVRDTFGLIDLLEAGEVERACLLTHPNRWAGSYPELVIEHAKDTAVNVVKRGLKVVT